MLHYEKVVLNHANLKRPVHIVLGTIAGYHWSDSSAATHVYTTAGVFPAVEKPEEIDEIINRLVTDKGGEISVTGTKPRNVRKR